MAPPQPPRDGIDDGPRRQARAARPAADRPRPAVRWPRSARPRAAIAEHLLALAGGTPGGHRGGVRLDRDASPAPAPLLDALRAAGKRVLLPVLLPDLDLDWAAYAGPARRWRPRGCGLLEPVGPRLGVDAVATADVVLVPGLAVSADGDRLGRGGGSYDRALARVPVGTFTCVLLYDDEVGVDVPVEPHDRPVTRRRHARPGIAPRLARVSRPARG